MSRMAPEEIRLRDEAMSAGGVVRPRSRQAKAAPPVISSEIILQPRLSANAPSADLPQADICSMSIQRVLEWAFGREHAGLEFDETGETSGSQRMRIEGIWLMMQHGAIG
ncbi:hypothetical protein SAMN05519105_1087 [Rhodobacter sp. 24-YEA-8]|nr:hypothetical protein SAMN05519105_1087 [Rhodobacter sp. 24-YEA-8]